MKLLPLLVLGVIAVLFVWIVWPSSPQLDHKDATYEIEGQKVTLVDGTSVREIVPGSASRETVRYFGNEVWGDINNDGLQDVAFLLTRDGGGSGTFFYVVVALGAKNGYVGTNAIFLGDRIAPQSTEFRDGRIIVSYAERGGDDSMTADPSIAVSRYFLAVGGLRLEEVVHE